jgi:hypothetical protein
VSVVLAVHAGAYVMLATDRRRTAYRDDGAVESYADGRSKIYRSSLTMIAGSGSVPLLDAVGQCVADLPALSLDLVLNIIAAARAVFAEQPYPAFSIDHGLRKTGWLLSARQPSGELALLSYHPGVGHELRAYGPGTVIPRIPVDDDTPEGVDAWQAVSHALAWCRVCGADDDLDQSIAANARIVQEIVAGCAVVFPTVSPECCIAVHTADGTVREVQTSALV